MIYIMEVLNFLPWCFPNSDSDVIKFWFILNMNLSTSVDFYVRKDVIMLGQLFIIFWLFMMQNVYYKAIIDRIDVI